MTRIGLVLAVTLTAACSARGPAPAPRPTVPQPPDVPLAPVDLGVEIPIVVEEPPRPVAGFPGTVYAADFEIPMVHHPRVSEFIERYTGRLRDDFAILLARRGKFEGMITSELRARSLPIELLHLPLVESGYSVTALSRAQALGLWQFIASTARIEGLEVSTWVDERRHPELATRAALQHLEKLYDRYGSWYLALAAYNSGPTRVDRALDRMNITPPTTDSSFWAIRDLLPAETREYVPLFLAASVVSRYPKVYGFEDVVFEVPERYEEVTVPDATDLVVIAEAAGVEESDVLRLNPHYFRGVTPPGRRSQVRLPVGTASRFVVAYAAIPPDERIRIREHVVSRGETLSGIAVTYGSTVSAIQEANDITRPNRLRVGQRLRIPLGPARRRGSG